MTDSKWSALIEELKRCTFQRGIITPNSPAHSIRFEPGLTNAEVDAVQRAHGFRFPPDLRKFLQTGLPRAEDFPDWRGASFESLQEWLDAPLKGVLFDVEHNATWLDEWGQRPAGMDEAVRTAMRFVRAAPRLIPVFAHRMIPDEPHSAGNPVLSVHQTDIIHYGYDLESYLRKEFGLVGQAAWPAQVRPVRFWDRFIYEDH